VSSTCGPLMGLLVAGSNVPAVAAFVAGAALFR
jgi:hypothetical protein